MESKPFAHVPVLYREVLAALAPQPGQIFLDGTCGGAGHACAVAAQIAPDGVLLGFDRDPQALEVSRHRLAQTGAAFHLFHANFAQSPDIARQNGFAAGDGALVDLGVSSPQLDMAERGFSYHQDGPLDMRMDPTSGFPAEQVVNTASAQQLADIFWQYGEERFSRKIAARIVAHRQETRITSTTQLAAIVKAAIPAAAARKEDQHPARRVFQALRIHINDELSGLEKALTDLIGWLKPGGVLCAISFHSGEDRLIKSTFARLYRPCTCAKSAPVCICNKQPVIAKPQKSQTASPEELAQNPRSRSARLRVAQKL